VSSMSNSSCVDVSKVAFLAARRAWPGRGRDDLLTAPVRRVYDSWMAVSEEERLIALDAVVLEGFSRRPGKDSHRSQCQDLTLSGSPFPASRSGVSPLTAAQVVPMGAPEPAEVPEETPVQSRAAAAVRDSPSWVSSEGTTQRGRTRSRAVTPGNLAEAAPAERAHSAPPAGLPSPEGLRSSRNSSPSQPPSEAADRRVAELERKLAQQDERVWQLFAQQLAEPNEDVSSTYVVLDDVWHKIGRDAKDNRCSWVNINALKKREVSEIIRNHSGTFPQFPCELDDVIGVMKRLPGVKDAQLTLADFAHTEVAKFMHSNARTIRLGGTAFSRSLEFQRDLTDFLDNDPHATEVPLDWVVEFMDKMVSATRGTFAMGLDTQTTLRLSVSHRLEKAMKVDHLTTNPLNTEREDFILPVVMKRIEDAAKRNLDLSSRPRASSISLVAAPPIPRGVVSRTTPVSVAEVEGPRRGLLSMGGKGGAGGRGGRDRGRGAASATPRSDTRAAFTDASPDE
jgi:hypothetical protein